MPFPWILQRYIFREMGKTFLLAAVALTCVFGLGGGLLKTIKLGDVTPGQLLGLMGLILPLAATFTLPIAALFSAAATYGRLSADNEFVACRSSGINMHVLFAPTLLLSVVTACVCFAFTNFLIPGLMKNIDQFIGADIASIIHQRLNQPRGLTVRDNFRVYADESLVDPSNPNRITLKGVAFIEVEGQEWLRYGTAKAASLDFARTATTMKVSGRLEQLSYYDRKLGQFVEERQQLIAPNEFPTAFPPRVKFLGLFELFRYLREPSEWHEVRREMERLRKSVGAAMIYDTIWQAFNRDANTITLEDQRTSLKIHAEFGALATRGGGIDLTGVTIEQRGPKRHRLIKAERAAVELTRGDSIADSGIRVVLRRVQLTQDDQTVERSKVTLGPIAIDPERLGRIQALSRAELLEPAQAALDDPLSAKRERARNALGGTVRRIVGTISERMAFSASMLALIVLGAMLGIVYRGAHVMTAFGVSFVPMLFVIVMIMAGKQMSYNAGTHGIGLCVMWSGILAVLAMDAWLLTRVIRR